MEQYALCGHTGHPFWHRPARQVLLLVPGSANGLLIEVNVALWSSPCSWECHTGWLMTLSSPPLSVPVLAALISFSPSLFSSFLPLALSSSPLIFLSRFPHLCPCDHPPLTLNILLLFLSVSLERGDVILMTRESKINITLPGSQVYLKALVSNGFTLPGIWGERIKKKAEKPPTKSSLGESF